MRQDKGNTDVRNHCSRDKQKRITSGKKRKVPKSTSDIVQCSTEELSEVSTTDHILTDSFTETDEHEDDLSEIKDIDDNEDESKCEKEINHTEISNIHTSVREKRQIVVDLRQHTPDQEGDDSSPDDERSDTTATRTTELSGLTKHTEDFEHPPGESSSSANDVLITRTYDKTNKPALSACGLGVINEEKNIDSSEVVDTRTPTVPISFSEHIDVNRTSTPADKPITQNSRRKTFRKRRPNSSCAFRSASGSDLYSTRRPKSSCTTRPRSTSDTYTCISRRPKSSYTPRSTPETDLISRPYSSSAMLSSRKHDDSDSKTNKSSGPYSVKITKTDLEHFLPRKSFFSCHDKALKEAGLDTDDASGVKARKKILMDILQKRKQGATNGKQINTQVTEDKQEVSDKHATVVSFEDTQTAIRGRKPSKVSKRRSEYDEEEIRVDYQVLLHYLRYVSEHPEEYLSHRRHNLNEFLVHLRPADSIVKLGNIFQRGQHGSMSANTLIHAVHDIRPRFCDPGLWTKTNSEKALLNLATGKKDIATFTKTDTTLTSDKSDEPKKTEYEQKKHKMEEWLKTVNAAQLNKAKELALRDLGEEDIALTKWWISLKTCNYLRRGSGIDRVCV